MVIASPWPEGPPAEGWGVKTLTRKLLRDVARLKGQVVTIALVVASGVMAFVMLQSTLRSLNEARAAYYEQYRLADVFVRLERAPEWIARRLARLPGVAVVETRVVEDLMVPMPGDPEPIPGRVLSIPEREPPALNDLRLTAGRMPEPLAPDEVVILDQFASAWGLSPGQHLPAVLNGTLHELTIVGVAMAPEFLLAAGGYEVDARRFVVLWMLRPMLEPLFRMEGAFNDASFRLQPGAAPEATLAAVDRELAPYGAFHAVERKRTPSDAAFENELGTLRAMEWSMPAAFLGVAAFLVNVVLARLVFLERGQIAVLKAVGYPSLRVGGHYLGVVAVTIATGGALGIGLGVWRGRWMTGMYMQSFRLPAGSYHVSLLQILLALSIAALAGGSGALVAALRVAALPPARAMRPPAPLRYRQSLLERLGVSYLLGTSATMVIREITRRPLRFAVSTLSIGMGVGIFIFGRCLMDSYGQLFHEVYPRQHREDLSVYFRETVPERAVRELEHIPGVRLAEPERVVPVRFRAGPNYRDSVIRGVPYPSELRHILDAQRRRIEPPDEGLLMTDQLAETLGVGVGDELQVDVLEGKWGTRSARVVGLLHEPFGLQAYTRTRWLDAWLGEEPRATAALLSIERAESAAVRERFKRMPAVIGTSSSARVLAKFDAQTGEMLLAVTLLLTVSAGALSLGVVYNNARVALSLLSRELATLRVLGFTRREVSVLLLGPLALQVCLGLPLGAWLGTLWSRGQATNNSSELVRLPLYISNATYGGAALVALVAGVLSALLVSRRLAELDLIGVLKSQE